MDIEKTLENIGLTKNEVKIYLALLRLDMTTSGPIIKKTGIHTSKVYDGLERLSEKGLVSYIVKSNTKYFRAVSPDRILDLIREKKEKIEEQEKEVKLIIPQLKLQQGSSSEETEAEVFQGWKGMETVYKMLRDTLKKGDTNYIFGASKGEDEEKTRFFFNRHISLLAQKGVKQKIIFNEYAKKNIEEYSKHPKLFQLKSFENVTPTEINLWGDNVMIVILRKNPTVILIKDKKVHVSFRQYFDSMWKIAKNVKI